MTYQLIPVASAKYRALRLRDIGTVGEWVEAQPVVGWRCDELGFASPVTLNGHVSLVIELPDGTVVDDDMTWPSRSAWAQDRRDAHYALDGDPTREWCLERRRVERLEAGDEEIRRQVRVLDQAKVPLDAGRIQAAAMLRAASCRVGRQESLAAALRLRREELFDD